MAAAMPESINPDFQELLLTMDIVDSIRAQQRGVESAILTDEDVAQLKEKLEKAYAAQGIRVSSATIEKAIRAKHEAKYTYSPPDNSIQVWLAKLYIARNTVLRKAAASLAALALVILAGNQIVGFLERQELKAELRPIEQALIKYESAHTEIGRSLSDSRLKIERLILSAPDNVSGVIQDLTNEAGLTLDAIASTKGYADPLFLSVDANTILQVGNAQDLYESESELSAILGEFPVPSLSAATQLAKIADDHRLVVSAFDSGYRHPVTDNQWATANRTLQGALSVGDSETAAGGLVKLRGLVDRANTVGNAESEYRSTLNRLKSIAVGDDAKNILLTMEEHLRDGIQRADAAALQALGKEVSSVASIIDSQYTIQIVTRGSARSGVWRYPNNNRSAKNFYLIVEAIGPDGSRLKQSITNEETGQEEIVSTWGLRVDESEYEKVKADKTDNGIIDNKTFGVKHRGYLKAVYQIPSTGGAITRW